MNEVTNEALATTARTLLELVQNVAHLEDTEGVVPSELQTAFQEEVEAALTSKGEKVDAYAELITWFMKRAAAADAEIAVQKERELDRLKKRSVRASNDAKRLSDMAIYVIRMMGTDKKGKYSALERLLHTFKVAKVADSCEVYDESLVPTLYKEVKLSITVEAEAWLHDCEPCCGTGIISKQATKARFDEYCSHCDRGAAKVVEFQRHELTQEYSIDKARLLKALKEPCEECGGHRMVGEDIETCCKTCNGIGRRLIPGARLITEKLRLVID